MLIAFPIKTYLLGLESGRLILWASLGVLIFSLCGKLKPVAETDKVLLTLIFIQISYIVLISIFKSNFDLTFILFYLEKLIILPLVIAYLISKFRPNQKSSYDIVMNIIAIQCFVIMLNIIAPETKNIIHMFANPGVPAEVYSFRHLGLTGFISYSNGFILFLSLPIFFITRRSYHALIAAISMIIALSLSRSSIIIYSVYLIK